GGREILRFGDEEMFTVDDRNPAGPEPGGDRRDPRREVLDQFEVGARSDPHGVEGDRRGVEEAAANGVGDPTGEGEVAGESTARERIAVGADGDELDPGESGGDLGDQLGRIDVGRMPGSEEHREMLDSTVAVASPQMVQPGSP